MSCAPRLTEYFTYSDYCQWPEKERWELIEGIAYAMTAPQRIHQKILFEVGAQIAYFLRGKPCEGYPAPFDVRLPLGDSIDHEIDTVVQPDLSVICDLAKLDEKGCCGAPDWIIEILSPSTALYDLQDKRDLYQKHGVREYWIVHPLERWVMVYLLKGELYPKPQVFALQQPTLVTIFEGFSITWDFLL